MLQTYLVRLFMLAGSIIYARYAFKSAVYYFNHKIPAAVSNFLMTFFTAFYCLLLLVMTYSWFAPYADYCVPLIFLSGALAYLGYSNSLAIYLQIDSKIFRTGQAILIFLAIFITINIIYFPLTGNSLFGEIPEIPNTTWMFQTFHLVRETSKWGMIPELIALISIVLTLPIIIAKLYPIRKKERLLYIGVWSTVLVNFNDILISMEVINYGVPLLAIGNLFEAIRFRRHFKQQVKKKILSLEHEVNRLSSMAQTSILASSIIHDIKTPLSIISMLATKLKKGIERGEVDLEKISNEIQKNSKRINDITNGYGQLLNGLKRGRLEPIKIKSLIHEALDLMEKKISQSRVNVSTVIQQNFSLHCRETEMVLVLVNLLNNSCEAINSLPSRWIQITTANTPNYNQIIIKDSGEGVDPKLQDKIFEFSTSTKSHGMGFGLALVKTVVHSYGYSIYLDNHSNNTTFIIEIPK